MKSIFTFFIFIATTCLSLSWAQSGNLNIAFDIQPNYSINYGERRLNADILKKFSGSAGVTLALRRNPRFAFEGGLRFVNKGQITKGYKDGFFFFEIDDDIDFDELPEEYRSIKRYNYNYLSIPLGVRSAFGESLDKGWFISASLAPSFYVSSQVISEEFNDAGVFAKTKKSDDDDIRKTHLNLYLGVGYAVLIKDKYQISVEPMVEYMFYRAFHKRVYEEVYHSLGVNFRFMVL